MVVCTFASTTTLGPSVAVVQVAVMCAFDRTAARCVIYVVLGIEGGAILTLCWHAAVGMLLSSGRGDRGWFKTPPELPNKRDLHCAHAACQHLMCMSGSGCDSSQKGSAKL